MQTAVLFFQAPQWQQRWQAGEWQPDSAFPAPTQQLSWEHGTYPNGETWVRVQPPTSTEIERVAVAAQFHESEPLDTQMTRLLFVVSALHSYVSHIHLWVPYWPYSLQEREFQPGSAVPNRIWSQAFVQAGVTGVTLFDPHAQNNLLAWQPARVERASAFPVLLEAVKAQLLWSTPRGKEMEENFSLIIVAPDVSAGPLAQQWAEALGVSSVVLQKERLGPGMVTSSGADAFESHQAKHLLFVDDILNTGSTLLEAIQQARQVYTDATVWVAVSHGPLVLEAAHKLEAIGVERVFVSDSWHVAVESAVLERVSVF